MRTGLPASVDTDRRPPPPPDSLRAAEAPAPCTAAHALLVHLPIVDRQRRARGWVVESVRLGAPARPELDSSSAPLPTEVPASALILAALLDGGAEPDAPIHAGTAAPANASARHAPQGTTTEPGLLLARIDAALLATEFVGLLDARRTVLRFGPDVEPTPEAVQAVERLRAAGFRFALDLQAAGGSAALWLAQAAYVTVPVDRLTGLAPAEIVRLRSHGARLVATGVDDEAGFALACRWGLDLFVGLHLYAAPAVATRTLAPAHRAVLRALCLAQRDAPAAEIDAALKSEAALPFRLLRYINSAGLRTRHEVRTIAEAVAMLGYRKLARWLGLLLVTARPDGAAAPALSRAALARARLMESLPYDAARDIDTDERFLVGLFSLLDAMLQMPMAQILHQLPLSEGMRDALLHRAGTLGALLNMVEMCERFDGAHDGFAVLANHEPVDADVFNSIHLDALDWADHADDREA